MNTWMRSVVKLLFALPVIGSKNTFDLLVIGSGSAGIGAAKGAASLGKSVALIEKNSVFGGDCTWVGCVPSKTLIATAKAAHAVRTAHKYGVSTGGSPSDVKVDMKVVRAQLDLIRQRIYDADDSPEVFESLGVTPIFGAARFINRKQVEVTLNSDGRTELFTARKGIVIATGAQPRPPDLPGLVEGDYLTYESIWSLESLPASLAVIGGGPIGCELAQALSRLGTSVTIIAPKLLPDADGDAGGVLAEAFADEGIQVVAGRARSVATEAGGAKVVTIELTGGATASVRADALLVAVGRKPLTSSLGLEQIGVELTPSGGIKVDGTLQTTARGVYAAGDCTGDKQYTHYAVKQGVAAMTNVVFSSLPAVLRVALGFGGVYSESIPSCTFTSPEVASIGLSEAAAIAKFGAGKVRAKTKPLRKNDGAIAGRNDAHGFIKLVYKAGSTELLGATIVAPGAGEMIGEIAVALASKMKVSALGNVMHAYPSLSWGIQLSALEVYSESMGPLVKFAEKVGLA